MASMNQKVAFFSVVISAPICMHTKVNDHAMKLPIKKNKVLLQDLRISGHQYVPYFVIVMP